MTTNPADVLTDEFIERIAAAVTKEFEATIRPDPGSTMTATAVRRVLRREREPVQTVVFEVLAPDRATAIETLIRAIKHDDLDRSPRIRLVPERTGPRKIETQPGIGGKLH